MGLSVEIEQPTWGGHVEGEACLLAAPRGQRPLQEVHLAASGCVAGVAIDHQHTTGAHPRQVKVALVVEGEVGVLARDHADASLGFGRDGDALLGFSTRGTVHVCLNNQVGFTTAPMDGRSSPHPTSAVLAVGAPVLHANADDPEAVARAFALAADWRAMW